MKRIFTSLVVLAAMFAGTTAWAQTLRVANVNVNLNATTTQTITGSNIQGSVTYNPSTKTLWLEGATIRGSIYGTDLTSSDDTPYYIKLVGTNSIITSDRGMRFDNSYIVLYGVEGSHLVIDSNASSSGFSCISTEGGRFDVWGIRLTMIGASKGFYGNPNSATLRFVNSIVSVDCDAGAVYGYKGVSYNDCNCTDVGVTFKSGTGYVDSSGNRVSAFHVWPLLVVGDEAVRTEADSKTGSRYSWKWTKSTKTLEITGDISIKAFTAISNYGIEGLTIKSDGNYTVASTVTGIAIRKNTNITGTGSLAVTSSTANGIVANADMNISMKVFSAQGKLHGFTDSHGGHKLTLQEYKGSYSDYRFAGASYACLRVSNLEMKTVDIFTEETWWNPSDGYVYYNDNISKSSSISSDNGCVCFKSVALVSYYNLYICGTQIRQNCRRITRPGLTSGSLVYDASSKTLTVTDVTLTETEGYGIIHNMGIDGLNIEFVGDNVFTASYIPIITNRSCSITGSGSLLGTGEYGGLNMSGNDITCTINGPQLKFIADEWSFSGAVTNTLIVEGSTTQVTFDTTNELSICFWCRGNLVLGSNLAILEPAGARFDPTRQCIVTPDNRSYYGKVVIGQIVDYGLYICETPVTSANAADILGDGTFRYDPSTETLTVTNANVTNYGSLGSIISNREIPWLRIVLVGDNTFTSRMASISSARSFYIEGDGTLTCESETYALYLAPRDDDYYLVCIISGPQIVFSGDKYGLRDWTGKAQLFVAGDNTRVTFKSADPNYATISNLGELTLYDGFSILEPAGSWFDSSLKSVTTDGSAAYQGTIVIGKALRGDLNHDGVVDIADVVSVLSTMAKSIYTEEADLNNDTVVDIADVVSILRIMAEQ